MKLTFENLKYWDKTSDYTRLLNNITKKWDKDFRINGRLFPFVNIIHYYKGREFKEKFGADLQIYKHIHLYNYNVLGESEKHEKPAIYIHTSINQFSWSWSIKFSIYGLKGSQERFCINLPKKMELTEQNIINYIKTWVENNLFYPENTYFGIIQRVYNIDKSKLANYLKQIYKQEKETDFFNYDMINYFEKIFNIIPADNFIITDWNEFYKLCKNYVKTHGRPKILKEVTNFNMPDFDGFDGDIYEAENLFYDEVAKYPDNVILV